MKSYDHLNSQGLSLFNSECLVYYAPWSDIRVKSYDLMNSRELPFINFERLDILCAWIGHPSEKLWPFEFSRASHVKFLVSTYIMRLNLISEWKVMTIWISWELPLFNFERLDILCAFIGLPSEMLWPFEFLKSFWCSISSVSIYYVPKSNVRVKSYDHLNSRELPLFNFEHLDILRAFIGHPNEKLWSFEFLESFRCSTLSVLIYYVP